MAGGGPLCGPKLQGAHGRGTFYVSCCWPCALVMQDWQDE